MEYQKITNLLDTAFDNVPRFINKRWIEVHDQSGSAEDRYKPSEQIRFKTSMLVLILGGVIVSVMIFLMLFFLKEVVLNK